MLSRKIIYSLLIIISVFFYILFIEKLSFYIMIFILAFPVALLLILLFAKKGISCNISPVSETAVRKNECSFSIKIVNRTIFPYPSAMVKIRFYNKISRKKDYAKIAFPLHPKSTQTLTFSLSSDFCGVLTASVRYIKIYDYIKLFSCRIKSDSKADVCIIPDSPFQTVPDDLRFIADESDNIFSDVSAGDDVSEIFELKDYIPGDKLNRIHWNLSSRQNQLITKHYSMNVISSVTIIVDIDFNTEKNSLAEIDNALDIFYTVSGSFTANGISHEIYINGFTETITVSDIDELNEVYKSILAKRGSYDTKDEIINSIALESSRIFIITNKIFHDYPLPDIPATTEMKCFFTGDNATQFINLTDNISVVMTEHDTFNELPENFIFSM